MRDNAHCGPILVTDDDDLLRTYVIDLLEQAGYAASGAASGQQALELARRVRPSLVVLDVLMPDLVISQKTVQTHVGHIYEKFGVHNRTQALASGYRQGLLELL